MKTLRIKRDGIRDAYTVLIEPGLTGNAGDHLSELVQGRNVALVTDTTVSKLYGTRLLESLASAPSSVHLLEVPVGEESKSLQQLGELGRQLAERGFERRDVILALGGGVVLDLAGFLAAIYMRGISHVSIPTTLIAQVDVCVGGKTGVNHVGGRNLLGSFYHPERVLLDPDVLGTLHVRDIKSGLAELIKTAIIGDERLFQIIENRLGDSTDPLGILREEVILKALRVKRNIVENDEREIGRRMFLNLGHTVGHALEIVSDFKLLRHGEAVAIGMLAASVIACRRRVLDENTLKRIRRVVGTFLPANRWRGLKNEAIVDATALDKKKHRGTIPFVLPKAIGSVSLFSDVHEREILGALEEVKDYGSQDF